MTEAKQRWYDSQRYTAKKKLEKNSRYRQIQLEIKIAALQNKAEVYEAQCREA